MILELLQLSPLKDQLTAWRGFARAGVTAFEEQNEMSMALLEGKGWTGADFEALLAFIDRADLEYVT
ncbi:MAG: hypothetical protein NTV80_07220, partial [Verrucomicrobia bacterium]|nr:hypothetical protein [Verrucomicrobiota bacterium]